MANYSDYLKWRGDISFEVDGVNEVDGAILSVISYFTFGQELEGGIKVTLKEAAKAYLHRTRYETVKTKITLLIEKLLKDTIRTKRFGNLVMSDYADYFDRELRVQFGAVTFEISEDVHFVAFRGTDDTVAGWAEDFDLCYKMPVPSQIEAEKYLADIMDKYPGKIYVGGHSKGGNLAIYSSFRQSVKARSRISGIYNYDGPGFLPGVMESQDYLSIVNKIHTFMPRESVVGMVMFHGEKYNIVQSDDKGINQHQPVNWNVMGTKFVYCNEFKKKSLLFNSMCNKWLTEIDEHKREMFIQAVFAIVDADMKGTFTEMSADWFTTARNTFKSYKNLDKDTKSMIRETIRQMGRLSKDSIKEKIHKTN